MTDVAVTIRLAATDIAGRVALIQVLKAFGVLDLSCSSRHGLISGMVALDRIAPLGLLDGILSVTRQGHNGYAQA